MLGKQIELIKISYLLIVVVSICLTYKEFNNMQPFIIIQNFVNN